MKLLENDLVQTTGRVILPTGNKFRGAFNYAPFKIQMENNQEENQNKTPSKMARLAWPKAKYGLYAAIIIIVIVNLLYYKDFLLSLFKN